MFDGIPTLSPRGLLGDSLLRGKTKYNMETHTMHKGTWYTKQEMTVETWTSCEWNVTKRKMNGGMMM